MLSLYYFPLTENWNPADPKTVNSWAQVFKSSTSSKLFSLGSDTTVFSSDSESDWMGSYGIKSFMDIIKGGFLSKLLLP